MDEEFFKPLKINFSEYITNQENFVENKKLAWDVVYLDDRTIIGNKVYYGVYWKPMNGISYIS